MWNSGVNWPDGGRLCPHVAPASCARCDGTGADDYALSRATPAERRAFTADMAAWNRRRAERAAADIDERTGGAV